MFKVTSVFIMIFRSGAKTFVGLPAQKICSSGMHNYSMKFWQQRLLKNSQDRK